MTPFAIAHCNGNAVDGNGNGGRGGGDQSPDSKKKCSSSTHKYLNVNLSHELWKDIKFSFVQIQHDDPSTGLYLFRLLWRWQVFNGIVFFGVLHPLSRWLFST